jgi:phosphomannomutase
MASSTPAYNITEDLLSRLFKRDDIRALCPQDLSPETAQAIGRAFTRLVTARLGHAPRLVIGNDVRQFSPVLNEAFSRAALAEGAEVHTAGDCPTEMLYYLCGQEEYGYDAGIMVTASHNPKEYNGMKFIWRKAVPFVPADLQELRQRMLDDASEPLAAAPGAAALPVDKRDAFTAYMMSLAGCQSWPTASEPVRVVIEALHGVGGLGFRPVAEALRQYNCEVIIAHEEPDPAFPFGVPNPLLPGCQQQLCEAVLKHHADLGIIFDGDADRAGCATNAGVMLSGSQVLTLLAMAKLDNADIRRNEGQKAIIMKNLCCSRLVEDVLLPRGDCEVMQTPVGHGVIKRLMRNPAWKARLLLAGEHSGHYYYPEFNCADSGILTALYMIACVRKLKAQGTSLEQVASAWRSRYRESGELNQRMESSAQVFQALSQAWDFLRRCGCQRYEVQLDAKTSLPFVTCTDSPYSPEQMPTPDLKAVFPKDTPGQCIIRPSGNEPVLRLFLETSYGDADNMQRLVADLKAAMGK